MPRGGYRPGSGRKVGDVKPEGRADFEAERARHEKIKADQRQHRLQIEREQHVSAVAQRSAVEVAVSVLQQSLGGIPARLQTHAGLSEAQAELAGAQVEQALASCAASMRAAAGDSQHP